MTMRGFLMTYLGAVIFVSVTGVSAYHALVDPHATTTVTRVEPEAGPQSAVEPFPAASLPKLRPHITAATKPIRSDRKRAVAARAPAHRPNAVASAHRQAPSPAGPWAYPPPPPPPGPEYYAYPARYPYPDYYPYYPRYYRSF
jgi:hypothetical protein